MLLMIDNYDSFTHNVVRYLRELNAEVKVVRNDQISLAEIQQLPLAGIVISPGPCTPNEAGISIPVIDKFAGQIPMLGVCLGHQAIGQVFGAKVVRAKQVMHGKTSALHHNNQGLFQGLPSTFTVARYHSLLLDHDSLPDELIVDAWVNHDTGVQEVMGIRHESLPVWGVQYHPEAIETQHGHAIFKRFLEFCDLI